MTLLSCLTTFTPFELREVTASKQGYAVDIHSERSEFFYLFKSFEFRLLSDWYS